MGNAVANGTAVKADSVTSVIGAASNLSRVVGPAWGLAIVCAICLLFPRFGVVSYLAKLWKEDRADARKQKVESERLVGRYRNRPKPKSDIRNLAEATKKGKEG